MLPLAQTDPGSVITGVEGVTRVSVSSRLCNFHKLLAVTDKHRKKWYFQTFHLLEIPQESFTDNSVMFQIPDILMIHIMFSLTQAFTAIYVYTRNYMHIDIINAQ